MIRSVGGAWRGDGFQPSRVPSDGWKPSPRVIRNIHNTKHGKKTSYNQTHRSGAPGFLRRPAMAGDRCVLCAGGHRDRRRANDSARAMDVAEFAGASGIHRHRCLFPVEDGESQTPSDAAVFTDRVAGGPFADPDLRIDHRNFCFSKAGPASNRCQAKGENHSLFKQSAKPCSGPATNVRARTGSRNSAPAGQCRVGASDPADAAKPTASCPPNPAPRANCKISPPFQRIDGQTTPQHFAAAPQSNA